MRHNRLKLILLLIIALGLVLSACSKDEEEATPEGVFEKYISYWMEEDFSSMYELLSSDSKDYISQEDFLARYENIYSGIGAGNIEISFTTEEDEASDEVEEVDLAYSLKLDTVVGTLDFDHKASLVLEEVEGEEAWKVKWNESMIFPQMEPGDKVRVNSTPARRGRIIDSKGMALADHGEVQAIGIVPGELGDDAEKTKTILAEAFETTVENIDAKLNASWVKPDLFVPIGRLSLEDQDKILELTSLPGVLAQRQRDRIYHFKEAAAHLTGYTGSITAEELEELSGQGYNQHSIIGKSGLERLFEDRLRPQDGYTITIVNKNNIPKLTLGETQPKDGEDIILTIDALLQKRIYDEMGDEKGTAVALNPKTGEVLALVNKPAYDPNQFILGLSTKQWNDLNEDPDKPLLNRFTQRYSPGSVFKPIVAAIAIEDGSLDPNQTMDITGLKWKKDDSWGNYSITRVKDPGKPVNLRDALVYSDNIYFARVALNMGEEAFISGAKKFGFGEEMAFPYAIKSSQLANEGTFANEIQLADSGYGQGQVLVSPLHLATMYTTFLNEGNMVQPRLLEDDGQSPTIWKEGVIDKATADLIKNNLIQVIEDPQGTASSAKLPGRTLGGKTGTAEIKASQDEEGINNGSFIVFDEDKDILILMHLEDVSGSSVAVSKVRRILENY